MALPRFLINPIRKNRFQVDDLPMPVNTVCESAKCPNRGECFSQKTVTFLLLGNVCTRSCRFCDVSSGKVGATPDNEIAAILSTIEHFGLRYVVLTSVTRDDLPDGGASHFVAVIDAIRALDPSIKIEVLVPDFKGNHENVNLVGDAHPAVFNHNLEMVPRLFPTIRPGGSYPLSLALLRHVVGHKKGFLVKTGIMVGLGETLSEVENLIADVANAGINILTIGQYLSPSKKAAPVARYVELEEYAHFTKLGESLGLKVIAGPLVRSSYHAEAAASPSAP